MSNLDIAKTAFLSLADRDSDNPPQLDTIPLWNCVTHDVVAIFSFPSYTPLYGEGAQNKKEFIELIRRERELIDSYGFDSTPEFVADGDRVVMFGRHSYKIIKTNEVVKNHYFAIIMEFNDGLISRLFFIEDASALNLAYAER